MDVASLFLIQKQRTSSTLAFATANRGSRLWFLFNSLFGAFKYNQDLFLDCLLLRLLNESTPSFPFFLLQMLHAYPQETAKSIFSSLLKFNFSSPSTDNFKHFYNLGFFSLIIDYKAMTWCSFIALNYNS